MRGLEHVIRTHQLASEFAEQNARTRELVGQSLELLRQSAPDTFLGRQTHAPFPDERKPKVVAN